MAADGAGIFDFGPMSQTLRVKYMHGGALQLKYFIVLGDTLVADAAVSSYVHDISSRGFSLLQLYFVAERRFTAAHKKTDAEAHKWY